MAVSIPLTVVEKIMSEAKATNNEIIGLLIGKYKDGIIFIDQSVSGEQESDTAHVTLFSKTTAKIVDKIMKKDIDGLIMGWYHSHPGYGIFMSQTDVQTQSKFQQFSDNVIALVVEPTKDEMGVFSLDSDGRLYQLEEDDIHIWKEGEDKTTPELIAAAKRSQMVQAECASMLHISMTEQENIALSKWQPLPEDLRKEAKRKLRMYNRRLTKALEMEVLTIEECRVKSRWKKIELGLRPPE